MSDLDATGLAELARWAEMWGAEPAHTSHRVVARDMHGLVAVVERLLAERSRLQAVVQRVRIAFDLTDPDICGEAVSVDGHGQPGCVSCKVAAALRGDQ